MSLVEMPRPVQFILRQVNAAMPLLYASRNYVRDFNFARGIIAYLRDYRTYARENADKRFPLRLIDTFPFLYDRYEPSGDVPRHYFHQDLWAAKKVFASGVEVHYDFASRVDGFIAHCLVFCKVRVFDIRPFDQPIENLEFVRANITDLSNIPTGSVASLSSLHAIEHIGLGRYGDPIDPGGYARALAELERVLAPGGSLYIGVPIGRERLEFNGHRVFAPDTIPALLPACRLVEFAAIDDENRFVSPAMPSAFARARYSCGLYHFEKGV